MRIKPKRTMSPLTSMPALMAMLASISGTSRTLSEAVDEVRDLQHGRVSESHLVRRVLAAWRLLLRDVQILVRKTQTDPGIAILVMHGLPATLQLVRVLAHEAARTLEPGRPHYGPAAWSCSHDAVTKLYNLTTCPRFSTFDNTVKDLATPSSGKMGTIDRLLVHGSLSITDAALEALTDEAIAQPPLVPVEEPLAVVAGRPCLSQRRPCSSARRRHIPAHAAPPLAAPAPAITPTIVPRATGRRMAMRTFHPDTGSSLPSCSSDPLDPPDTSVTPAGKRRATLPRVEDGSPDKRPRTQ